MIDERTALTHYLDAQRRSALAIVDGLSNANSKVSVVPSGWTVSSLLVHLEGAEEYWFEHVLAGLSDASPPFNADPVNRYREQIIESNRIVASFALHAVPIGTVPPEMAHEITSTRDVILHMIEETARHLGHLDIARELLDGSTGLGPH